MLFTALALLQLGNALALRSESESLFRLGLRSNRFLSWVVLGTLVLQIAVIYWAPAQSVLKTTPLSPADLAVVLVASTAAFWLVEAEKLVHRRRQRRAGVGPCAGAAVPNRPSNAGPSSPSGDGASV